MVVEDDSKKLLCINTQKGLFVFNRMTYGIAPAAAIFQRTMEQVLAGIDNVKVILDDMLITGKTEEHLKTLELVLARLKDYGLKVKPAKYKNSSKIQSCFKPIESIKKEFTKRKTKLKR